jgi:phosphoserine aminotransferase
MRPTQRPSNACFGSGPTAKRPGWSPGVLGGALVGRSHRSAVARARLGEVLERSRALLGLPEAYRIAIVPGSDTGAFEMAMWSLLGARGVDVLAWESFGAGWLSDARDELRLEDLRALEADYGRLPDLDAVAPERDVVFTWNGTTSGVRVPDGDWIAADRDGVSLCDATSAAFAMALPWTRLDVATYSWQKALGGEAQHGILILSPRAVERLETFRPARPLPKLLRLTAKGALNESLFRGDTINTPSMLAVEDALDGLRWAERIGGLAALIARSEDNLRVVANWVDRTPWIDFLAERPETRSTTSICLKIVDPAITALPRSDQAGLIREIVARLEAEQVAYDIAGYRDAPPGLRLWGGATVERADLEALLPWLDWAFEASRSALV